MTNPYENNLQINQVEPIETRKLCEADQCGNFAAVKVDIKISDGSNEIFLICYDHLEVAQSERWEEFLLGVQDLTYED